MQNCSSLSIVNFHPQLQYAGSAFDAGIPWRNCQYQYKRNPLEFQITSLLHSIQTMLIYLICFTQPPPLPLSRILFCLRLPLNTFHGINLSLSHSLSHFASVSLSLGRDVMSLIAARWRGARKNRINLVSPEPSLFPLLYPMHQLKLSRRGPLVSPGSVRYTKRGRRERYSREGNRWDLQRGEKKRRVDERGRQEKTRQWAEVRWTETWQIDLRRDKVGFSRCRIKVRKWWHKGRRRRGERGRRKEQKREEGRRGCREYRSERITPSRTEETSWSYPQTSFNKDLSPSQ